MVELANPLGTGDTSLQGLDWLGRLYFVSSKNGMIIPASAAK